MEKKGQSRFPRDGMYVKKCYRLKRSLPGFILVLMMQLFINHASIAQNVTISVKNVDMKSLIKIIEKQTQLGFLYNESDVVQLGGISLDVKNVDVKEVLDLVFKGTSLIYKINKDTILISSGRKVSRDSTQKERFVLKGVVTDGKKIPLPGVTIMVKGTISGVTTDKDGKYSIVLTDPEKAILFFTFIGMKRKEVAVKGEKVLNVVLEEDVEQLEDVIVTGYQKVRKNELTGAAFSVKAENIMQPHMFSVDAMLQGQMPGMHVINPSSTPGASPKIRIRGESSISGNREPLWVLDGRVLEEPVKVSASELNSLDAVNFIGNAISFINPDDIERIDVLMDAAATAIYGVRAANGVIVITTKKGEPGPPRVSYSTSVAFQRRPTYKDMRLMNSKERTEVSEEMHERGLRYDSYTPSIIGYEAALKDLWERRIDEKEFARRVKEVKETNTDWYDLLMHDRVNHRHSLALSGGGSDMRYRVSLGFQDNGDAVREVEHSQYTLNASLSNRFSKKFDMGLSFSMALSDDKRPYEVNPLLYAYETSRVLPAYQADGSLYFYNWEDVTISKILYGITDHIQYNIFNEYKYTGDERFQQNYSASLDWNWEIITGLQVTGKYSYSVASVNIDQWTEERSASAQHMRQLPWNIPNLLDDPDFVKLSELPYGGIFKYDRQQNRSYNLKHSVSYAKTLADKHNLSLYLGTEVASIAYTGLKETRRGYYRDRGHQFVEADQTKWIEYAHRVSGERLVITDNLQNTFSAYTTFAYTYDSKYILNANIRVDGSNAFGQNKSTRFLPVWSVSGRWNLEREKFIEALGFVNEFALKASYGWQGNVHPDGVPFIVAKLGPLDDRSQEHISTISKYPNDKLTWERTASSNFGVSFSLFDDLLAVSGDYFLRVGKKQLVQQKVDPSNGLEQISINGGDVRNKGYSIAVSVKPIRRDELSWIFSFTTSHTINKVENSGVRNDSWENYLDGSLVRNGASLNTFYSYRFDGLNNKGIPTFEGLSLEEDGVEYANLEEALATVMVKSGRRIAPFSGGINTSFRYKRLSFSASFAFNVGNKVRLNPMFGAMIQTLPTPIKNMTVDFVDRWKKPGDELHTVIPALSNEKGRTNNIDPQFSNSVWQMYDNSNIRVVPGDFLKCNSMSLSYMFNPEKLKQIGLKTLNVSVAIDKPFVIKSKELKGRDPEQLDLSSGAMPQLRGYSFSLSTSF